VGDKTFSALLPTHLAGSAIADQCLSLVGLIAAAG